MDAAIAFEDYIDGPPDYWQNITGCGNYYDIRKCVEPDYCGDLDTYLNQASIRQQLHVGNHVFDVNSDKAGNLLTIDLCKTVKPLLPVLFDNYKVLIYNGQFDFIVGAPTTEAYLPTVMWSGQHEFNTSPRTIWKVDPHDVDVAGYVRAVRNFTFAVVRGAGHILPYDQPRSAYDMITRFVDNMPFMD